MQRGNPSNPDVESLIREEWPKLERYLRLMVPEAEVGDIVHDAFEDYLRNQHQVTTNARGLLWLIVRRRLYDQWRRHRTRAEDEFDAAKHSVLEIGPTLSSIIGRKSAILQALQSLTVVQMEAVTLVDCEGQSVQDAARMMEMSLATFNRRLAEGRSALRSRLGPLYGQLKSSYEEH